MSKPNIYKVHVDDFGHVDIYLCESRNPISAMKYILRRVDSLYSRSRKTKYFAVSVDLVARNITLKEYKIKRKASNDNE